MTAYLIYFLTLVSIYAVINLAYAIPVGYTGMLNLGHLALVGVGTYTGAILITKGVSFWIALPAAALLAAIAGFLLAFPARRVKGDYYALLTLGFVFVLNAVLLNWTSVTKGPFGITGIERPDGFVEPAGFLALSLVIVIVIVLFVSRVVHSPFGKALEAVRDDDLVAESLGKPTAKLRMISLTISAAIAGIGGVLLATFIQFINPQLFSLDTVVAMLAAVVLGGLASLRGAILGTVILYAILEGSRFLPLPLDLVGALRLGAFSLLLLVIVIFKPKGLFGRAQLE